LHLFHNDIQLTKPEKRKSRPAHFEKLKVPMLAKFVFQASKVERNQRVNPGKGRYKLSLQQNNVTQQVLRGVEQEEIIINSQNTGKSVDIIIFLLIMGIQGWS
jgi:hypothetical protein